MRAHTNSKSKKIDSSNKTEGFKTVNKYFASQIS